MHSRYFCTGVKLPYFVWGLSQHSWHTEQRYKNIPDLGLKHEPVQRVL